eukprot:CAMPEP_0194035316 /NCGR_PEP_ID=MMETSP0009_2-20130614/7743_1 /TAXON_ID=210454 /ORGANISM="Grammatophora oceanica, Strain CCMP 410" /LENGTH=69 /DNA_ID=CAMNT_0038676617 /DNA_START=1718 /DNA_END=1924 /DNA_ORIENTATION=-
MTSVTGRKEIDGTPAASGQPQPHIWGSLLHVVLMTIFERPKLGSLLVAGFPVGIANPLMRITRWRHQQV